MDPAHRALEGLVTSGAIRDRRDRPIKNGRWHIATSDGIEPAGWGDVSFADLDTIASNLNPAIVFVVLPERSGLVLERRATATQPDPHDATSPGPSAEDLVAHASYAVIDHNVWAIDRHNQANRRGNVWIRPGYRVTATARIIRTRARRLPAMTPGQLLEHLLSAQWS